MKFLKSIATIVALLVIVSVDAKQLKKVGQSTTQPMVQPTVTEKAISDYIDKVFNDNYDEMSDMLLKHYDDYEQSDVCEFIASLARFIADEFPTNIPTAKKLFNEEMDGFCESIENDKTRMMNIHECINKEMNKPNPIATNVAPRNTNRPQNANRPQNMKGQRGGRGKYGKRAMNQ